MTKQPRTSFKNVVFEFFFPKLYPEVFHILFAAQQPSAIVSHQCAIKCLTPPRSVHVSRFFLHEPGFIQKSGDQSSNVENIIFAILQVLFSCRRNHNLAKGLPLKFCYKHQRHPVPPRNTRDTAIRAGNHDTCRSGAHVARRYRKTIWTQETDEFFLAQVRRCDVFQLGWMLPSRLRCSRGVGIRGSVVFSLVRLGVKIR